MDTPSGLGDGVAEDVTAMAIRVGGAPLVFASVEIVETPTPALRVRLVGGEAEVADGVKRLVEVVGRAPSREVDGQQSRDLHEAATSWEDGATLVVRMTVLPRLLDRCMTIAQTFSQAVRGELTAHALDGTIRVKADPTEDDLPDLADHLTAARIKVGGMGGSLVISTAPPGTTSVARTGGEGADALLSRRVKDVFDPSRVLASQVP